VFEKPVGNGGQVISAWDPNYTLQIGNEASQSDKRDRAWQGQISRLTLFGRGLEPGEATLLYLDDVVSRTVQEAAANSEAAQAPAPAAEGETAAKDEPVTVREFAFPYPASFPVRRFGSKGTLIKTRGAVLDNMYFVVKEDGQYTLSYEARTTMHVEIDLQLQVCIDDRWYPITLPKRTIDPPANEVEARRGPRKIVQKGRAAVLAQRRYSVSGVRRRGTALFGTPPTEY
jgi:hypothetical protein